MKQLDLFAGIGGISLAVDPLQALPVLYGIRVIDEYLRETLDEMLA